MSIVPRATRTIASFDADIATLIQELAALHALAHSLPADVSVPLEQCIEFAQKADMVDSLMEQLAV